MISESIHTKTEKICDCFRRCVIIFKEETDLRMRHGDKVPHSGGVSCFSSSFLRFIKSLRTVHRAVAVIIKRIIAGGSERPKPLSVLSGAKVNQALANNI